VQAYQPQCIRASVFDCTGGLLAEASITIHISDPGAPDPPSDLTADPVGESQITWQWSDNSISTVLFPVYFDPGQGPPTTLRGNVPASRPYWGSTGLQANTRYCVGVCAVGSGGESSETVSLSACTRPKAPVYGAGRSRGVFCNHGPGDAEVSYRPCAKFAFAASNGFGEGSSKAAYYAYTWNQNPCPDSLPASVRPWTKGDLALSPMCDGSYYLHLWACNVDGLTSTGSITLGPYIVRETCAHAKTLQPAAIVTLWNKVVSGLFADGIYIQEPDRAGGIRVEGTFPVAPGSIVSVEGTPCVESGEAVLADSVLLSTASGDEPKPVLMNNKALGGAAVGFQPATIDSAGPPAVASEGLSPVGLLVRTTGTVTYVDQPGQAFAYIDDGSNLDDGSGRRGLRVLLENAPAPAVGSFAEVTGCCSTTQISGNCVRRLRPRTESDIACSLYAGLRNGGFEDGVLLPWELADGIGGVVAQSVSLGMITPHSGGAFLAVLPQNTASSGKICQVATVPPGRYHLSVWSRVFHGCLGTTSVMSRVGIDPTGGTDPGSLAIVWSSWDMQLQSGYSEWHELPTPAVDVPNGACTVFLHYLQRAAQYQVNCFDDAELVRDY
jgi:hypothetical protein